MLKPIIPYQGGKTKDLKYLLPFIPSNIDEFKYVELFVGGGALYFYLNQVNSVINDSNDNLINMYKQFIDHGLEIVNFMKSIDDVDQFNQLKNIQLTSKLDQAKQYYTLKKKSFNSNLQYNAVTSKYQCCYTKRNPQSKEYVDNYQAYTNLLKHSKITNMDFRKCFKKHNEPGAFMFIDPPYYDLTDVYNSVKFSIDDHKDLAGLFKQAKCYCLVTVNDCEFNRDLYSVYIRNSYETLYTCSSVSNTVIGKILIITNY